ncbi:hypothetical protein FSP39_003883 [Pinctada imbricata]|uniref:Uncharacterized protein n=1 Tax=Pinctada imbricata TaxID=66713 RepID=A0AA88XEI7_PINIB|nr:hypothetical protein FSP39_003883 [Pinctada imbricata]
MDTFVGKWEELEASNPKEVDQLLESRKGVDSEMKEKFLKSTGTMDYKVEGNTVTVAVTTTAFPDAGRSYSFTSGEPFDDMAMDGSPYKATITISGDDTMTETGKHEKYGDFKMVRKVEGDSLKCKEVNAIIKKGGDLNDLFRLHEDRQQDKGVPPEVKEQFRKTVSYFDYDIKGNKWRVKHGADMSPGKELIYEFELGKEFEGEMLDGSKFKSVVTVNGDNELTDKMNNEKWGEFTIQRSINGNSMTVVRY